MGLYEKIITYCLKEGINDSNNLIAFYELELKYYKESLRILNNHKPIFFKSKKIEYENNKQELIKKIIEIEKKINYQYKIIYQLEE